jgi:hypothetical protein
MKKTFSIIFGLIAFITITAAFTYDEPKFKNLKILPKNISEKAMDSIMHHYSISLNVGCDFCHVENKLRNTWDMASDAKHEKLITRKMMTMTNAINKIYFPSDNGGKGQQQIQTVTCYTCHKGEVIPADLPPVKTDSSNKK